MVPSKVSRQAGWLAGWLALHQSVAPSDDMHLGGAHDQENQGESCNGARTIDTPASFLSSSPHPCLAVFTDCHCLGARSLGR